ncbi:MAG: hypothetical protein WCK90_03045 [archaeon]
MSSDIEIERRREIAGQIERVAISCGTAIPTHHYVWKGAGTAYEKTGRNIIPYHSEYHGEFLQTQTGRLVCEAAYLEPDEYCDSQTYAVGLRFDGRTVFLAEFPVLRGPVQLLLPLGQKEKEEKWRGSINEKLIHTYIPGDWEKELEKVYLEIS